MANKLQYDHEEIQRYLNNQMSVQEMHAFEKAMMDDPFLEDALEGYKLVNREVATQHLKEIEQKIKAEKEDDKVVAIKTTNNNWWRIAALFILIAGLGFITYRLTNTQTNDPVIAANKPASIEIIHDTIKASSSLSNEP